MNHPSLEPYEKLVQEKYINKQEQGDLILFNYTDSCTFERKWDEYTLAARGIIFNKLTGDCIARPLGKFFNISENERTLVKNLPDEPYEVFEKVDGSLGILYFNQNRLHISTRGSFTSQQAITATEILRTKYPNFTPPVGVTLLFEIIYPENRMTAGGRLVVDYGDMRDLILLAGIYLDPSKGELSYEALLALSTENGFPIAKKYSYTIAEMIEMQKTLPVEQEGFVVHYLKSNFRVKIKGNEYCIRQKLINDITPLNLWALFKNGFLPDTYKMEIPEEILPEALAIEEKLKQKYDAIHAEIVDDASKIPYPFSNETRKDIALWLQANKLKHHRIMFSHLMGKKEDVEEWVLELIRPKSNIL